MQKKGVVKILTSEQDIITAKIDSLKSERSKLWETEEYKEFSKKTDIYYTRVYNPFYKRFRR